MGALEAAEPVSGIGLWEEEPEELLSESELDWEESSGLLLTKAAVFLPAVSSLSR